MLRKEKHMGGKQTSKHVKASGKMKSLGYGVFAVFFAFVFTACATVSEPDVSALDELSRAIRDVSDNLNSNVPAGSVIAFINVQSESEGLSNFIIQDLNANAINDRIFTVVDRSELDSIREEQGFQLSGEVDDITARDIGRFLGAHAIVIGNVNAFGGHFRLTIRALDVQTAVVLSHYNRNLGTERAILALTGGGQVARAPGQAAQTPAPQGVQVPGQQAAQARGQQAIVIVEGASLAEKLQWLHENAASNTEYRIVVTANESIIPKTLSFARVNNVTVRLISDGGERVLSLPGSGTHFTVEAGVTLILDSGITLQGRDRNSGALVVVNRHGALVMNEGARIVGNNNFIHGYSRGGGVFVNGHGTFTMNGGEISGNTTNLIGHDGGGGVYINRDGSFTLAGGLIYGNTTTFHQVGGGGVLVRAGATFTMTGGVISNNTTAGDGGGVFVSIGQIGERFIEGTFTMTGGEISGNTASFRGGGVMVWGRAGGFTKTGGTIYGFGTGNENRARFGYAVYAQRSRLRNSTAGPGVRMDSSRSGAVGGWEN